jgi:tetratricopeptide (TPR) repeat protein
MRARATEAFIGGAAPLGLLGKSRVEMQVDPVQSSAVIARTASRPQSLVPALAAGMLAVAGFAALLASSRSYVWVRPAADEPYNLVVEGLRSGHVWMAKEAPPALADAANPYDFATYRPYLKAPWSVIDLSYYRGHLYAYFGVTPAVILFWPYRALTGGWLHQAFAVFLFCVIGYAAAVGVALAAWRKYFPGVGAWAGAAIALLLGSVTTLPVFLVRPGLYEVSISCAFACVMLSLAALWNAWHRPTGRCAWLAGASAAYGLAVGARPSLLFGAAVLFLPAGASLWSELRERKPQPWLRYLVAAFLPISAIGAGLAAYNLARFGSPLQFGHDYQLSGNNVYGTRSFAPRFFWGNVRLYFTEPLRWHAGFPFVWEPATPPLPSGHLPVEFFFGALTNLPILLAAALVPLAWLGGRRADSRRAVQGASAVLLVLFLASAVPICCYAGATSRYLLDFIPALALLSVLGLLALERTLRVPEPAGHGSALGTLLRIAVRGALAYSVLVGWLLALALGGFYRGAEQGMALLNSGRIGEGIATYTRVTRINPDFRGQAELMIGTVLLGRGKTAEAVAFLNSAATDDPGLAAAHFNLGEAYLEQARFAESADAFRRAAALDPFDGEAEADLGVALFRLGGVREAIEHERIAIRIEPTLAAARENLRAFELAPDSTSGK